MKMFTKELSAEVLIFTVFSMTDEVMEDKSALVTNVNQIRLIEIREMAV